MVKLNKMFSKLTALLILVSLVFTNCIDPVHLPQEGKVIITPGEGDPTYVYIDKDGNYSETDTGRTALFIENNLNAKGVLVVSEKAGGNDAVTFFNSNNNSAVTMFFKQGSNFPFQMAIDYGGNIFYAYLSQYRTATSSYDIVFQYDNEYETLHDLVLNPDIFDLYQYDDNLNDSQNLRLRNIVIAMGLWGSLAVSLDDGQILPSLNIFKKLAKEVKKIFDSNPVIATVVSVIVVPVVFFTDPVAAIIITGVIIEGIKEEFEEKNKGTGGEPLPQPEGPVPVSVRLVNAEKPNKETFFNGDRFHIDLGEELWFNIRIIGIDTTDFSENIWKPYDPDTDSYGNNNRGRFALKKVDHVEIDEFSMMFKKILPGHLPDGKIAFGFKLDKQIAINDKVQPVLFTCDDNCEHDPESEYDSDSGLFYHDNMLVIWFCIYPNCTDQNCINLKWLD